MQDGRARLLSGFGHGFAGFGRTFLFLAVALGAIRFAHGQPAGLNELSEEEKRQVQIAERFLTVLERTPRRGTALDRIYGHHVEFGTLDDFMQSLRDRVKENEDDGTGWMLLGLFEAHRGEDANAIDALKKAEAFRPDDALASYYLGQSLLLLGQPEEAVAAFGRAIDRKPRRTDMLEIFQQLGRVHQRAQRTAEALQVWERLESLFPDDPRVQEQIAVTLVEEGEYALALPRYQKLAELVRDDYRRTMFRIEVAELKIRENQRDEGISDFEELLADLNPEGWLHRDVRRRVEDVFLRSGNQDGLVTYYERWIDAHPEDVDGMARLAKFLASSSRIPEATEWMRKALKLAPTRTELRKAFIDQLVDDQRYREAIQQYELLVQSDPGNPDFLRDWGRLVLKSKDIEQPARQAEAARIWRRILSTRPDDALTTAQVADLFRQSKMNDEALKLYQDAVKLAPNDPQYREYLGEFYHILKRPDDALATWKAIAEGGRHTAINVARLAEIYNSFGYLDDAVTQIAEACKLDPKDFSLQLKAAEYHARGGKFEEALDFVNAAEKLAANDEENDAIIVQRIDVFRSSRRLDAEIDALASDVQNDANAPASQWHLLARYCEADSRWADATEAIDNALKKESKSIPALTTAARIAELSGDYGRAADMNRQLAETDRRSRGDHLMNVARLEAQMGRADEALKAGQDLIVSAPGNTDNYEFYARLCFQLGKSEEGVNTLRKAVRINPTEPYLIMALGSALSDELRTDEAIEVYWRAFEKTDDLDDKTSLTMKLTDLYLQLNQFDRLLERLERDRREEDQRHAMTICLAQAHHSSGDYGTARQELESLLSEDTRDTALLQQLSKLCEEGSDIDGAVEYQRQLVTLAPGHETEYRLASLLQTRGDRDEASEILLKLMRREEDPARRLRNLDSLLSQGAYENVISITEPMLSEQRDDWELLYREGVAWASLEKFEEADDRMERLLSLTVAHNALGVIAEDRHKQAMAKARSNNLRGIQSTMPQRRSPLMMLGMAQQARQAAGLDPDRNYYGGSRQRPRIWTPSAFGEARLAAYAWLMRIDQESAKDRSGEKEAGSDQEPAGVSPLKKRFEQLAADAADENASRESIYDWMYVEQLQGNLDSIYKMARRLAQDGGREEQQFFLTSLTMRGLNPAQQMSSSRNQTPTKKPLADDDLELMMQCYDALSNTDTGDATAAVLGGQVAYGANGQVYIQSPTGGWVLVSGMVRGGIHVGTVISELKLAGREERAAEIVQAQIDSAENAQQVVGAMNLFLQDEEFDRIDELFPKWVESAHNDIARGPVTSTSSGRRSSGVVDALGPASNVIMTWMGHLGPEEEHAKILAILDESLDLGIEIARRRRAERSRRRQRSSAPTQYYPRSYSLRYGKETIRAQFDYPQPNEYIDATTLMLLREVFEVFKRNEVLDDLPADLEKRLATAGDEDRLYGQLMLAYVRWWLDEKEDALALLKEAGESLKDDPTFRLEIAMLHQMMGDNEDALEIVDGIVPRDQKLVQRRELLALQLAERIGDIDRARQSAERLFGLRLDNNTQINLVGQMRRLGMHEMAEAVMSRIQRRSGNSLASMGSLMAMYQGQGKADLAQQLAHNILRRTKTPFSGMSSAGRNPFRYRSSNSDSQMRTQALRLLQQTGALKELIARVESQIAKSPNSPRLYEQLIEYYEAANERDKVGGLLERAVESRPDSVLLRYRLAKHFESTGKLPEACDQYLEILKQKPQWIAEDLYNVRRTFDRAKRSIDLVKAIQNVNLAMLTQPYYVIDLVTELMRRRSGQASEQDIEVALNLFEKVFDTFPQYRNQMLSRMYDRNLWKNERVFELGKRAILPTDAEVAATPWFGLNNIYSYSSGGRVNGQFHQILSGVDSSGKTSELEKVIRERLDDLPGWHGGEAMLALIELKQNKKKAAKKRLEALVADEDRLKAMPSDSCWMIGQELDQFEDTRPIALKLFETAASNPQTNSQIQYSPIARLVQLYNDIGRKDDARHLLQKQLNSTPSNQYDPQYSSYLKIENSVWAGQQFLKLECPVDAVRVFRGLSGDSATITAAGRWYGNRPDQFKTQIEKGLQQALSALDDANADEAMSQLLAVPANRSKDSAALDLMLLVPDVANVRTMPMESPLVDLLISISKEDAIAGGVRKRLDELQTEDPSDMSIGIARAAYLVRMKDDQAADSLQALVAAISDQPLEEIRKDRRPNSRQRRAALAQVPLWLIARECLKTKDRHEIGTTLAERALQAARRQADNEHTAAILYDWGRIALDQGDRELAESKWSELLDIVTRRPERRKPGPNPRTGAIDRRRDVAGAVLVSYQQAANGQVQPQAERQSPNRRIPPLTLSQFRLTMEIALAAAENGMPALSRKAVRASMSGGSPVPDLTPSSNASPFAVPRATPSATASSASAVETEVAGSLRKVIAKWQGDAYPPAEVYALLLPIVFPENRPAEVLMFADSSKLQDAQVTSLGAVLVRWAKSAGQLDDLVARIEERSKNAQTRVAALVMRTRVELARGRVQDARKSLDELAKIVQGGTLPPMVQLACHAALPAAAREALEEPAYAILRVAVNLQVRAASSNQNNNSTDLSLGKLVSMVNRHLSDEPEEVKKFFENYLVGRQSHYSRYGGTYGQYLQWRDWAAIAEEAAKTGLPTVALDYMGRVADFTYENYSRPSTTTAMAVACREMSWRPAEQQYAAWRDWTLPAEGRKTVRLVGEWVEPVRVPKAFLDTASVEGRRHSGDMLCNFEQLLASAEASGQIEQLRDLAKAAYDEKLENAQFLYALVLIQLDDLETGKQVIEPIVASIKERLKRQSGQPNPDGWGDYIVYRACLQSPKFVSLYRNKRASLQQAMRGIANQPVLARLSADYAFRSGQQERSTRPGDDPQLTHWFPASTKESVASGIEPWWVVQEGHIAHLAGTGSDLLYFAYPLTGEFEFTVDAYDGSWAESEAGYGGLVVEAQRAGRVAVWSTGGHESISHASPLRRGNEYFGRVRIKVADGKMQYILNNHTIHEEQLSDTSPWINLYTTYPRATTFRNPRIIGDPTIPREVVLVNGDRMDGWNTSFFGETQPRHRLMALKVANENDHQAYQQREEPTNFDWRASDGLLRGKALTTASKKKQSWAYYHRPLRDQESLSYEFEYVPGQSVAHPTIGRIALLLEETGVEEHWICRAGWDESVLGVTEDNRIVNSDARRGPKTLPLVPGGWNAVTLTLADGAVQLTLNGELIYERALEPELDHRFGFYRLKSHSLKVREPKLTGPWPESVDGIRGDLLATTKQYDRVDRRLINSLLGERFFKRDTRQVLEAARGLPPVKAYRKLLAWVLPSADHAKPRLYFDFVVDDEGNQEIACPAYELLVAADSADKLTELSDAVGKLSSERARLAMQALLAIHEGRFDAARESMVQMHALVAAGLSKFTATGDRSIEFVVVWQAVKHPELQFAGMDIAYELRDKQRDNKFKANDSTWGKWVDVLVGHVDGAMLKRGWREGEVLTQWSNVPYYKPDMHADGYRHTDWLYRRGVLQHVPGGTWGQLFFQSPLRGNFEIAFDRAMHGHREMVIAYGMHAAEPRYDYKATRVTKVMHGIRDVDGEIKIPRQGGWMGEFRVAVDGNKITTFVNGVQIHQETLSPQPDPWVVLQSHSPGYPSTVRNLRITGSPEIPDEIDLIDIAGWASWRADVFGESFSLEGDNNAPWKKVGDEIHGQLRNNIASTHRESLLMYQRPMLEDGVIEFESFYIPGEFEVHPAVGRTALVAGPDGVARHRLTNAQYEDSGLAPGNASPIDGAASKVDFKVKAWNRYKLSLEGDQLTLAINGTDVAVVTLSEPATRRHFGLFRYSNKTKSRVRNLVYRGEWPKTLPPADQQQLARSETDNRADWALPIVFDLQDPVEKLKAAGLQPGGPADRFTQVDGGTRMLLQKSEGYGTWPRFHLRKPIVGDCIVTLDFEKLKVTPPKEGWGCNFVLRAVVDEGDGIWVDSGIGGNAPDTRNVHSVRRHKTLANKDKHDGRYLPMTVASGRLRLVRTGSLISTYFAEKGSDEFKLWEIWPVGDAPIKEITVQMAASDAEAVIDTVVSKLTIQAREAVKTASVANEVRQGD